MDEEKEIMKFSKRLYTLRQRRKQSARDMSLSLGMAPNYINTLESAKNYPTMQSFLYICEYMGITPREFFDYEDINPETTNELHAALRRLDAKEREHLLAIIDSILDGRK